MTQPVGGSVAAFVNLQAAASILERDYTTLTVKAKAVVAAFNGKDKPGWSPQTLKKAVMELEAVIRDCA